MPASSVPFVAFVLCVFGSFMVALGSAWLSQVLAERREARQARLAPANPIAAAFPKTDQDALPLAA